MKISLIPQNKTVTWISTTLTRKSGRKLRMHRCLCWRCKMESVRFYCGALFVKDLNKVPGSRRESSMTIHHWNFCLFWDNTFEFDMRFTFFFVKFMLCSPFLQGKSNYVRLFFFLCMMDCISNVFTENKQFFAWFSVGT